MKKLPLGVKLILAFSFMLVCGRAYSQTNTFPTTGAAGIGTLAPDASALFEVTSTTQGILVPRMTKNQRDNIVAPATGLLIYQTSGTAGFYYFDGSAWSAISFKNGANKTLANLTAPTAVNADLLPASTNSISLGSAALSWKNIYAAGSYYIGTSIVVDVAGTGNAFIGPTGNTSNTGAYNTAIGNSALKSNISAFYNTAVGSNTLYTNTTGEQNTAIGFKSLYLNSTGSYNTASGLQSLYSNTTGSNNTANGKEALYFNTTGTENTAVGNGALFANSTASYNTATGYQSLYSNTSGLSNTADGWKALYANTTGYNNTAVGLNALSANTTGYKNTATGLDALYQNTTGFYNTAHGEEALYSNTIGGGNTANGFQALFYNTTGYNNTANGVQALYYNTGTSNTACGIQALYFNTTGYSNTADGIQALYYNNTGYDNTATGYYALGNNTSGYFNTANGSDALGSNTTGYFNTSSGYFALGYNITGSFNTAIGSYANCNAGNYEASSAFGTNALITASNQVRIGDGTITSIGGYANWSNISDGRFKKNVKDNVKGLEFINKLQPVTYTLDITGVDHFLRRDMPPLQDANGKVIAQPKDEAAIAAKEKIVYSGFIAQDVEKAAGEVGYDFSGVDAPKNDHDVYGLRYAEFVVPLVKAVQELSQQDVRGKTEDVRQDAELENLKKENESLKAEIESIKSTIANPNSAMTSGFAKLETQNPKSETLLGQNIPNPFDNSTLIPFRIPKNCHDASIMITNTALGEVVSVIPVACNEDHLSIDAGMLSSGTYSYTLYVDGKMIDTKQMVIQK